MVGLKSYKTDKPLEGGFANARAAYKANGYVTLNAPVEAGIASEVTAAGRFSVA